MSDELADEEDRDPDERLAIIKSQVDRFTSRIRADLDNLRDATNELVAIAEEGHRRSNGS